MMIVVVFGVSGSGKSTIGTKLARAMRCEFLEGDALHSQDNIDKMRGGSPLTDADRAPWLAAVHACIVEHAQRGEDLVVACSALKREYRASLARGVAISWVYLKGSPSLIRERLEQRHGHFMTSELLASQFAAMEEPVTDAIVVDIESPPDAIVAEIVRRLSGSSERPLAG
jgi:gluconokinase